MRFFKLSLALAVIFSLLVMCKRKETSGEPAKPLVTRLEAPEFHEDSAYAYVERQVAFGPRVPGTPEHERCKDWLYYRMNRFGWETQVQESTVTVYDGTTKPMYNIIASMNPGNPNRILLAAHWDTRPYADQDIDRLREPIDGANDGASGVGVLMEVARQLSGSDISLGIDIIFFDVEDYGQPEWSTRYIRDTYALGSQHWSRNPHVKGYDADYGILLDMVGAEDAIFTLEGYSMQFAPEFMRKVWDTAIRLGHSRYFHYERTDPVIDDHYYVNTIAGIPMIDIIHYDRTTMSGFGPFWHTHNDNMDIISRQTLNAVGETVLKVVALLDEGSLL